MSFVLLPEASYRNDWTSCYAHDYTPPPPARATQHKLRFVHRESACLPQPQQLSSSSSSSSSCSSSSSDTAHLATTSHTQFGGKYSATAANRVDLPDFDWSTVSFTKCSVTRDAHAQENKRKHTVVTRNIPRRDVGIWNE